MSTERDRVISITLTDAEYRAFVARQPKPVDWLRARILRELEAAAAGEPLPPTADQPLIMN